MPQTQSSRFDAPLDSNDSLADPNRNITTATRRAHTLKVILLCLGLSTVMVAPFFVMGQPKPAESRWHLRMPDTDDMWLHYDQMKSFYAGLAAGKFYPRWEEDTNRRFGAPTTSYYPPAIYYLTSAFYAVTRNWLLTLLGTQLLAMIASALAIYVFAQTLMSTRAAALTMATYIVLPYHLIDQYDRGAIAELLSFIWMPLMLFFTTRLFGANAAGQAGFDATGTRADTRWSPHRLVDIAGLAVSYGAFIWSHPPTAYQFSLVFALYVVVLCVWRRNWVALAGVVAAVVLGSSLSAAYLYPAAVEADLIRNEFVSQSWPYYESYVFAHTARTEEHVAFFHLINNSWLLSLVSIALCTVALVVRRRVLPLALKWQAVSWLVISTFVLFFMTRYSSGLGSHIPKLEIGVYSWRMLSIATLTAALFVGACAESITAARSSLSKRTSQWMLGLLTAIVAGSLSFTVFKVMRPLWNAEVFTPETEHFNYAVVPRTAPEDPEELPDASEVSAAELDAGNGTVEVVQWQPEHREVRADLTDEDDLWIRTFNFPGWVATVDGHPAEIKTGEDLGDIMISLASGTHVVLLDYLDTPPRRAGKRMSVLALILLGAMLAAVFLRQRSSPALAKGSNTEPTRPG
jgi:hypothetical protein